MLSAHAQGCQYAHPRRITFLGLTERIRLNLAIMKDSIHVSKENYLKAILEAEAEGRQVIPAMLAHWLEVSAPAVTMALKRLKRDGYVEVGEDGIVRLTAIGPRDRLSNRAAPSPHRAHAERSLRHGVARDSRRSRAAGTRRFARLRGQAQRETRRRRRLPARKCRSARPLLLSGNAAANYRCPRLQPASATPSPASRSAIQSS